MSCGSCITKIKSAFLKMGDVSEATVQLAAPQGTVTMQKHIAVEKLQEAIKAAGDFVITEADSTQHISSSTSSTSIWFVTYKPILLVFAYITAMSIFTAITIGSFNWETWMRHFMAAFFLVFSFFKLLDLKAFAEAYSSYDIIAKKWNRWGYVYPFIELALGIAFLVNFNPLFTNGVAFAVMSISIIGVLQAVFSKRKIQCACLGTVFNLPMSTITVIEDGLMIVMSAVMIVTLIW